MPTTSKNTILEAAQSPDGQRIIVAGYSVATTLILLGFPGTPAALVLGIPYLFFVPGYVLVRLFFWKGTSLEAKFVLSLGLSVLAMIFLGLFLVLTPLGLTSDNALASVIVLTMVCLTADVLWKRPEDAKEREHKPPATVKLDSVVVAMLGTAIAISVISAALIITADYPSRTYFAITDEQGSADIETTRAVNTTMALIVHMKNGEDGPRTFRLVAYNDTLAFRNESNRVLQEGELWQMMFNIPLYQKGEFLLNFDLYIQEQGEPEYFYGNLHLWVKVS
ncbi:MAG: DUF1616 domain-containing protein [Thermoplasmata archaeon]